MGKVKLDKSHKILIGALCSLSALMVGLIIGIIIVKFNSQNEGPASNNDGDVVLTEEDKAVLAEQQAEFDAQAQKYADFESAKSQIREEAAPLLTASPVDVAAVSAIYDKVINQYASNNEFSYVAQLIFDERNLFLESDLKAEALESLITREYSMFPAYKQFEFYSAIFSLAQELNRTDVIAAYEPLYNETSVAWDAHVKAIEDYTPPDDSADDSNEEDGDE